MEISVVVPTILPRSEIEVVQYLDRSTFQDYEIVIRDDVPVTKARNEGYKQAEAEKIVFLDDDSMPREGYLEEASKTLEEEVAVAGRTVHPRDDIFAGEPSSHYDFGENPRYVKRFWGCNMAIRKEVLDAVGGWDEKMGWGHEEKELAERVLKNHSIYYNPKMVVDHVYAESLRDYWNKMYHLEKGTPYYLQKQGYSKTDILSQTLRKLGHPKNYLRRTPALTVAQSGSTLAGSFGRIVGLFDDRYSTARNEPTRTKPQSE